MALSLLRCRACVCVCVCKRERAQARQVGGVNTLAAPPSAAAVPIHPVAALRTRWLFSGCHWLPRTPHKHLVLPRLMRLEGFQPTALWASHSPFKMPPPPQPHSLPPPPPHHTRRKPSGRVRALCLSVCVRADFKVKVFVVPIIATTQQPPNPSGRCLQKMPSSHKAVGCRNAGAVARSGRSTAP